MDWTESPEAARQYWTVSRLTDTPAIRVGWVDDLIVDEPPVRVWWSRLTRADGAPVDHAVTIEHYHSDTGEWRIWCSFEPINDEPTVTLEE